MTESRWLWFIAGPNGAGKSTYAPNLSSDVDEIVRPDELAYRISPNAPEKVAVQAARLAIQRVKLLLAQRRSFAIETTLSGRFHLDLAKRARSSGWKVGIVYIGLRNPKQAIERVRLRHLMGGHNVPSLDVRRRYARSLRNLVDIYPTANRLLVLDNSSARRPMKPVLEVRDGRTTFKLRRLPKWLGERLRPRLER